jgi:hypothetical protein
MPKSVRGQVQLAQLPSHFIFLACALPACCRCPGHLGAHRESVRRAAFAGPQRLLGAELARATVAFSPLYEACSASSGELLFFHAAFCALALARLSAGGAAHFLLCVQVVSGSGHPDSLHTIQISPHKKPLRESAAKQRACAVRSALSRHISVRSAESCMNAGGEVLSCVVQARSLRVVCVFMCVVQARA